VELKDMGYHTHVLLANAGVPFSIISAHPIIPETYLHIAAGLAVREGLPDDTALRALTEFPAKMLGLSERMGSLDVGKDADLVVWSEDPFEFMSQVCYTVINGSIVWQGGKQ
jgi:imidazolonepropionase-like amidohydrolase